MWLFLKTSFDFVWDYQVIGKESDFFLFPRKQSYEKLWIYFSFVFLQKIRPQSTTNLEFLEVHVFQFVCMQKRMFVRASTSLSYNISHFLGKHPHLHSICDLSYIIFHVHIRLTFVTWNIIQSLNVRCPFFILSLGWLFIYIGCLHI